MRTYLRILVLVIAIFPAAANVHAQPLDQRLSQTRPGCADVFANAMEVLPEFKRTMAFDSVAYTIDFIDKYCGKTLEHFDLKVLLAIQQRSFRVEDFYDVTAIHNLDLRAVHYQDFINSRIPPSPAQAAYYRFTADWAAELLRTKKLDEYELLICKVIAGEEKAPGLVILNHKSTYPYFSETKRAAKTYERKKPRSIFTITGGAWFPTNNMSLLGVHPTVGLQLGQRKLQNELDLTIQFRFLQSANPYTVSRGGTSYELTHFFGGYIGLDYTRYLVQTTDVELALLAGAGYDGFDISSSDEEEYLKPYGIGSFNFNTGIRFNVYYTSRSFIGLAARYNMVNYKNTGGSSLKGDSFSLDLVLGFGSF